MYVLIKFVLFFIVCLVQESFGFNTLPPYIKLCSRRDPNFNACALKNGNEAMPRFVKGDPDYLIPNFQAFKVNYVGLDTGERVKLYASNVTVYGLDGAVIKELNWNFDNKTVYVRLFIPKVHFVGTYSMSGQILIMNLSGTGPMNNTHYENDAKLKINYEIRTKKNEEYLYIDKLEVRIDLKKVHFNFENLLNNAEISDTLNKFLNENWKVLIEDLRPQLDKVFSNVVKSVINPVASRIPFKNIVKP